MHVNGFQLICPHCQGETFDHKKILLNTAGMTLFNLDWLNKNADAFFCQTCKRIEWFVDARITSEENRQGRDCPRCGTTIASHEIFCSNCRK